MGLKRRHKKKKDNQMFDPNKVIKSDHKRKCFVVDEAPRYPLYATPRQLQKRFHYYSESDSEECAELNNSSDDDLSAEYLVSSQTESKKLIRVSTSSTDSEFDSGGTAPADPKKMLGKFMTHLFFLLSSNFFVPFSASINMEKLNKKLNNNKKIFG